VTSESVIFLTVVVEPGLASHSTDAVGILRGSTAIAITQAHAGAPFGLTTWAAAEPSG
jgi:hypothetical protein